MAMLQGKHVDVSSNQQEEAEQWEQDMRNSVLAQNLDQSAWNRSKNLKKAKAIEISLIQLAQFGWIAEKISESGLIEILERVSQQTEMTLTVKFKR